MSIEDISKKKNSKKKTRAPYVEPPRNYIVRYTDGNVREIRNATSAESAKAMSILNGNVPNKVALLGTDESKEHGIKRLGW